MGWLHKRPEMDPVQQYSELCDSSPTARAALVHEITHTVYLRLNERFSLGPLERDYDGLWYHIPRFPVHFSFQVTPLMIKFAREHPERSYGYQFYRGNSSISTPEPLLTDYRNEVISQTIDFFRDSGVVQIEGIRIEQRTSNTMTGTQWEDFDGSIHETSFDSCWFDLYGTILWQADALRRIGKMKQSQRHPWDVER